MIRTPPIAGRPSRRPTAVSWDRKYACPTGNGMRCTNRGWMSAPTARARSPRKNTAPSAAAAARRQIASDLHGWACWQGRMPVICSRQRGPADRMWIKIGLVVGVLAVAAAPEFFPVVNAAPEPAPVISKPAPRTFKPVCRGDEVLDSRPDPAWVSQSFNKDNCRAPLLPAALDGTVATREQVVAAMAQAKAYAAAADAFQKCGSDFVAAKRVEAARGGRSL